MPELRLTYDKQVDAAYLYIKPSIGKGEVAVTQSMLAEKTPAEFHLDFDSNGALLGIEILWASRVLSSEMLATAE